MPNAAVDLGKQCNTSLWDYDNDINGTTWDGCLQVPGVDPEMHEATRLAMNLAKRGDRENATRTSIYTDGATKDSTNPEAARASWGVLVLRCGPGTTWTTPQS